MDISPAFWQVVILLLTSIISGVVGFVTEIGLPENIRSKIKYRIKSWRKRRSNNNVTSTLTAKYIFEDQVPLTEASEQVKTNLSSIVNEGSRIENKDSNEPGDRHYIEIKTSRTNLTIEAAINAPPGETSPGAYGHDRTAKRVARSVTVKSKIRTEYNNLRWALELGAEYFDKFDDTLDMNLQKSSTYNVTCELKSPTVIEDFLVKLSADCVSVKNESIEVEFEENRVTVRNLSLGDRPDVFDKLQDLIIYYG